MEYCEKSGKPSYDKKGALSAKNKRFKEEHVKLRVYLCPHCDGWHLTHKEHYDDE